MLLRFTPADSREEAVQKDVVDFGSPACQETQPFMNRPRNSAAGSFRLLTVAFSGMMGTVFQSHRTFNEQSQKDTRDFRSEVRPVKRTSAITELLLVVLDVDKGSNREGNAITQTLRNELKRTW